MLFNFTVTDKQGEVKEIMNKLTLLQLEKEIKKLDNNLFNYNVQYNKVKKYKK